MIQKDSNYNRLEMLASEYFLFSLLGLAKLPATVTSKDRVSYEAKSIGATGGWRAAAWNTHHLRRHEDG